MSLETLSTVRSPPDRPEDPVLPEQEHTTPPKDDDRRLFTKAVVIGTVVAGVPMLWLLWSLWSSSPDPLRGVQYDNFYDLQAQTLFGGHLYIKSGLMGIEAFVHHGRQYTYFGIFPSLLRMPIMLMTGSFFGRMTAPSLLLSWLTTACFSSLLLWRTRILLRGKAALGRAEAVSYGMLMATILGGSVVLYLMATPYIYNEDFAWSIALTVGSIFALLGVMERPTSGRVWASGVLILFTNLDRTPTGYACTIAALLVAAWFGLGRGGPDNRRWALPLVAAGVIPFLVGAAVTYAKFGIPIGLPMADQVWAQVNAHRRYFLVANGGKAFSFAFLPSTLTAYLQPFGLHLTSVFPYITPPLSPAKALAGAVLDETYPTASLLPTAPLLFLATLWGVVTAFRRRGPGLVRLTRLLLIAAAAGTAGVFLWGYISQRYLGDLMPFLILASCIGLVDVWRRCEGKGPAIRTAVTGIIGVLAAYGIAANLAISAYPIVGWTLPQTVSFVSAQKALSGSSLNSQVHRGARLPLWAPAGQLFIVGKCSGLYLSTGDDYANVPGQQIQHFTWLPVEQSPQFTKVIGVTFNRPVKELTKPLTILKYGTASLVMERTKAVRKSKARYAVQFALRNPGTTVQWPPSSSWYVSIRRLHTPYRYKVVIDPNLNQINVISYGNQTLGHFIAGDGPAVVQSTPAGVKASHPLAVVTEEPVKNPQSMQLCRSLLGH